jgi:SAM-dependent methyltransferase
MEEQVTELLEKVRQQFETSLYPRKPLEQSPKDDYNLLFIHNLTTSFYLRNQLILDPKDKVILDAGCGSGWKSLILAESNPRSRIIGIDISEKSVQLARERLKYHGFENAEFHVLSISDLSKLGMEFDYINCDEVLYLLPDADPSISLKVFKSVLKPDGLIRGNLHSFYQRINFFRAQRAFKLMGLMNENPEELELEIVRSIMKAIKDQVELKTRVWKPEFEQEGSEESILMNHLLQGDKGYTIPDLFAALRAADLEFVSMVNWRRWELTDLFKDPDDLPAFLAMSLPEVSVEDQLHLFELLQPQNRLLDFWCGHPDRAKSAMPVTEWELSDWQTAQVRLHPQLCRDETKQELLACISEQRPFEISRYLPLTALAPIYLESTIVATLLPLWEKPQPFSALVDRWLQIRSCDPTTLEPTRPETAAEDVQKLLTKLESFLYVLVERFV